MWEWYHRAWLLLLRIYQYFWPVDVVHEWSRAQASLKLRLPGSFPAAAIRVLQVTDVHLSEDPLLPEERGHAERMHGAFRSATSLVNGTQIQPIAAFRDLLDHAKELKVDLVALTGDLLNFPQKSMVDWIVRTLNSSLRLATHGEAEHRSIPFVYCSGNHDWFYEGSAGSQRELWGRWRQEALHPLYAESAMWNAPDGGKAIAAGSFDYGALEYRGLLFVTIDNALQQVNDEQLAFFRAQVLRWIPMVLMLHVPLSVREELRPFAGYALVGDPDWGANTDRSWTHERRERWPESGNDRSTELFLEAVQAAAAPRGPVIVVVTGHVHVHGAAPFLEEFSPNGGDGSARGAVQYVGLPGFQSGYRYLEIETVGAGKPLPSVQDIQERQRAQYSSEELLAGISQSLAGTQRGANCWWHFGYHPEGVGVLDVAWVESAVEQILLKTERSMRDAFQTLARALRPLLSHRSACPATMDVSLGAALSRWADPEQLEYVQGKVLNLGVDRDIIQATSAMVAALKRHGSWEQCGNNLGAMLEITALGTNARHHPDRLAAEAAAAAAAEAAEEQEWDVASDGSSYDAEDDEVQGDEEEEDEDGEEKDDDEDEVDEQENNHSDESRDDDCVHRDAEKIADEREPSAADSSGIVGEGEWAEVDVNA